MRVLWSIGVLLLIASGAAGCSSSEDGKKVAGRTRSLATAADPDQVALDGRVRRRRTTAQATGVTAASLAATVRVTDATAAILRLPTGEEVTLAEDATGGHVAELTGTPEEFDARCPDGAYTFMVRSRDGATLSLTLDVVGPAPVAPTIVVPGDLAIVPPGALVLTWTWPGTATLFDVSLVDVATGDVAYRAPDLAGREHVIPASAVTPARRYRLEVAAASASDTALIRLESATSIQLDVSGAP